MSLKLKLLGGTVLLLVITVLSILSGLRGVANIHEDAFEVLEETFPALDQADTLIALVKSTQSKIKDAYVELDEEILDEVDLNAEAFQAIVGRLQKGERHDASLTSIHQKYVQYVEQGRAFVIAYIQSNDASLSPQGLEGLAKVTRSLSADIKQYRAKKYHDFITSQRRTLVTTEHFKSMFALVSILLGGIMLANLLVSRNVIKAISELVLHAKKLAAGKMDQKLQVTRQDELGVFQESFESMRAALKDHIENLDTKVRERTTLLQSSQKEMKDLLNAIDLGIFTFNEDLSLNEEHSLATEKIFSCHELKERKLVEFLGLDHRVADETEKWVKVMFSHANSLAAWKSFCKVSPISHLVMNDGKLYVDLDFQPVMLNGRLEKIMVLARDVSVERASKQALDAMRKEQSVMTENMMALLNNDRDEVAELLEKIKQLHQTAEESIPKTKEAGQDIFRHVHTLKGNAATLGMMSLAKVLEELEILLSEKLKDISMKVNIEPQHWMELLEDLSKMSGSCEQLMHKIFPEQGDRVFLDASRYDALLKACETMEHGEDWHAKLYALKARPFGHYCHKYRQMVSVLAHRFDVEMQELKLEGAETLVLPETMSALNDIINHLLRNAMDHGLRECDASVGAHVLSLGLFKKEKAYSLEVRDTGRGIDLEAVKSLVIKKGLRTEDEWQSMSSDERYHLIFEDGLSTKVEADDISGKGMGLAAVQAMVVRLNGQIGIQSKLGEGTSLQVEIPVDDLGRVVYKKP